MGKGDEGHEQVEGGKTAKSDVSRAVANEIQRKAKEAAARSDAPGKRRPGRSFWSRGIRGLLGGVKRHELYAFCDSLALLIECGVPLVRSLRILADRMDNLTLARAASNIAQSVDEGRSFTDAAAQQGSLFPRPILMMLRAGERSGRLGEMLGTVARQGEQVISARRKVLTMLIYPAIVVVVAIVVVAIVFGIVARGFSFFTEMGVQIPWTMRTLLKIGNVMRTGTFWIVVAIVVIGVPTLYLIATQFFVFRLLRDRFLIRFPGIRHLVKEDLLANFGRVFSTMLHSGIPLQESLQAAHDTCRNEVARMTFERTQEAVRRGQRITPTLEEGDVFPLLAYDLCAAGEESGALDRVFAKLGDYYEEKLTAEAAILSKIAQPLIVLILALIVGFVVISFFNMWSSALMQLQNQVPNL
jgi:type IV pilus assembly protein PilC